MQWNIKASDTRLPSFLVVQDLLQCVERIILHIMKPFELSHICLVKKNKIKG